MNGIEVVYMVLVGVIGVMIGMIVELIVDNHTIEDLRERNYKLKLENEQLRRENKTEVIEIVDNTVAKDVKFGGF
jgi:uncharacterized membrane protein (DUF106 family)